MQQHYDLVSAQLVQLEIRLCQHVGLDENTILTGLHRDMDLLCQAVDTRLEPYCHLLDALQQLGAKGEGLGNGKGNY